MEINNSTLDTLRIGFNAKFNEGFDSAESFYAKVAMLTSSTTRGNTYGWLGKFPRLRQWIGDRVINNISRDGFRIENEDWEATITIGRNDILDDNIGIYSPMFRELGREAADQPDIMVASLIDGGFISPCYDGQNFFDAEHPVIDLIGQEHAVSNMTVEDGYAGPAWYMIDGSRSVMPFIYQERQKYVLKAVTADDDSYVFMKKEFLWGVDGRSAAGFGFWQLAHAGLAPLNEDSFTTARRAMTTLRGDGGKPLGIKPTMLLVPSELEEPALNLIKKANLAGGESNIWADSVELIVSPWLSPAPPRPLVA